MYASMEDVVNHIESYDVTLQLQATRHLKKEISTKGSTTIDAVIKAEDIVPELIRFLYKDDNPELQFEAASVLQSMAAGTRKQISVLMRNNYLLALDHILSSTNYDTACQAVWAIGFIAAKVESICDHKLILMVGRIPLLVTPCVNLPLLRAVAWTLSTFAGCLLRITFSTEEFITSVVEFLPIFIDLLKCGANETDVLKRVWQDLMTKRGTYPIDIDKIAHDEVIPLLVNALSVDDVSSVMLALRAVTIISYKSKERGQALLDANVVSAIGHLLDHPRINIQKDVIKFLDLLSKKYMDELIAVLQQYNLIAKIIEKIDQPNYKMRQEMFDIISTFLLTRKPQIVAQLINGGIVQTYCRLLVKSSKQRIYEFIKELKLIFQVCEESNQLVLLRSSLKDKGGWEEIKGCQKHKSKSIVKGATDLISTYFVDE